VKAISGEVRWTSKRKVEVYIIFSTPLTECFLRAALVFMSAKIDVQLRMETQRLNI
jgi:hypothetical protein